MSTRRGPKVEPHKNPRLDKFEVVVNDLPEKPKAQVFEEPQEKLMSEEEIVAQEEFINEVPEELIAEDEFITSEAAKVPHFDFQDEYHFGPGNGDAIIDALPQPQKRKKRIDELNQTELRMFHKTGFMPEI